MAEQILTRFKESQEAWTQVDVILDLPCSLNTKYFALQVLEILIKTRWKALPREQCEGKWVLGKPCVCVCVCVCVSWEGREIEREDVKMN